MKMQYLHKTQFDDDSVDDGSDDGKEN